VGTILAQLQPLDGSPPIEISKDLTLVGRTAECDLRINHRSVSKLHCIIVRTDGLLLLRDLGSTNGTRVNGQRVRRAALLPNDELAVANHKYRIHLGPAQSGQEVQQESTQKLDTDELRQVLHEARTPTPQSDSAGNKTPHKSNPLPDVYPKTEANKQ
jgi:pSer/pThr/pTyr-binding forkhead associated (FHA) protein